MRHAVRKSNTLRANTFEYNELERRQLLAVIISGTAGNDNVAVTYVGTNIVNVTVHGVPLFLTKIKLCLAELAAQFCFGRQIKLVATSEDLLLFCS